LTKPSVIFKSEHLRAFGMGVKSLITTFAIAFGTGLLCQKIGLPAPFLLGSLFGVWCLGGGITPLRGTLGVPRWFHVPVVLGLGTLIGGNFRPDIMMHMDSWASTVSAMFGATILATLAGLYYLIRIRKYDFTLALLSCIPGGQAEVIMISRDLVDKDYVVALFHLVRVALVFCLTPLILAVMQGHEAVQASNAALHAMPSMMNLPLKTLLIFGAISIISLPIARLLKLPMPHLIGPLLISSALHILGLVEIPRISEFVILAQLTIGGAVGARLAKVPVFELATYLRDAIVNAVIVLATYGFTAWALASWTSIEFMKLLLAFIPGGLYEVTLLALIFGFDIAFVAFHHTVRVMLVFMGLPMIIAKTRPKPETN
jgi:membrane AbrB-like protein